MRDIDCTRGRAALGRLAVRDHRKLQFQRRENSPAACTTRVHTHEDMEKLPQRSINHERCGQFIRA